MGGDRALDAAVRHQPRHRDRDEAGDRDPASQTAVRDQRGAQDPADVERRRHLPLQVATDRVSQLRAGALGPDDHGLQRQVGDRCRQQVERAVRLWPCGAFSSSTMIVMMMARTPSLNASIRLVVTATSSRDRRTRTGVRLGRCQVGAPTTWTPFRSSAAIIAAGSGGSA
ncbi:MAG TPA: hypothetical protein VF186_04100 [Gaiellaceae bacterium]